MKLERQSAPAQGVGTLMYGGDEPTSSVSIDALQVAVGAFAAVTAYQSKLGPIAKAALVLGGILVAKRGVTRG